jgi:tRNA-dependent cyclodipeptide synthase
MRIGKCLNIAKAEIKERRFNIFIGISLGNKYFTREHIRNYLLWGLENTRERVAILIPDKIHGINYEVKSGYSFERASAIARRKGDEMEKMVVEIMGELEIPPCKVQILRWEQIENESYLQMLRIFREAFLGDAEFRTVVTGIVKEIPNIKSLKLDDVQYGRLSQYVINELPVLIGGIKKDGINYELLPYPGFSDIDYLALDLQEGKSFPKITKQLDIRGKSKLVEAYVE